ncbi:MAG: outer membrane lipoprotein-sorting protein [Rhodothermaceae bacterium]
MIKTVIKYFSAIVFFGVVYSQNISPEIVLKNIDDNMFIQKAITKTTMIIHTRSGSRSISSKSWINGKKKSLVEYIKPAREKGKKMLRLGDKLWTYIPEPSDRIITISGHLLKQSVMGSDLSYEDITENRSMLEMYNAEIISTDTIKTNLCYVVLLSAKEKNVTYHKRKIWVDIKKWLPVREERFAKSGKLLKRTEIIESMKIGNRWYPKKIIFKDVLSRGKGTEYIIDEIKFDVSIPKYKFTKAALRR